MTPLPPAAVAASLSIPAGQAGQVWPGRPGQGFAAIHHRHPELEANLVLRGRGVYLIGRRRVALQPGSLLWLAPGGDHCLVETSPDYQMHIAVWRPALAALGAAAAPAGSAPCRVLPPGEVRALARLVEDLAALRAPERIDRGLAHLLLRLRHAWAAAPAGAAPGALDPRVAAAAHLLAAPDGGGGMAAVARRVGWHRDHLARRFRAELGVGPAAYRTRHRLGRVLAGWDSGRSLRELALAAGFGSYTRFHRAFSDRFGIAPRRWRPGPFSAGTRGPGRAAASGRR